MKARKTTSTIIKILTYCILLLVLAGGVGFLAFFTRGFKSDFKTFYLRYNNQNIMEDTTIEVLTKDPLKFDCKYLFENASNSNQTGFAVAILPGGEDFDFTVDGQVYSFLAESDLTAGFDIVIHDSGFEMQCNRSTAEVLQRIYSNAVVEVPANIGNHFILAVTSYNGKATVYINMTYSIHVESIILDKKEVEVWL